MTDNVCHSILKTATQQIIHSAGFEAANNSSIETLADVFGKYIELLGSTVSAFAHLNGRTIGNAYDLLEALDDVSIEPKKLKSWLEQEGKCLTPCWSEQSDPGRLIQGIISNGRPDFSLDMTEYRYGEYDDLYDILSPSASSAGAESMPSSPIQQQQEESNNLPNYIPKYFPSFPIEINQDDSMEEAQAVAAAELFQKEQQLLQQQKKQQQQDDQQFPILVKNRKKPIENPFSHIIPFEDSSLTDVIKDSSTSDQVPPPLALLLNENNTLKTATRRKSSTDEGEEEESELTIKKRKLATNSLMTTLVDMKHETRPQKVDQNIQNNSYELFKIQTENAATSGNYLFNKDGGVFDQVIRKIADPIVISKLTNPNLQTDIALNNNYSTPLATPTATNGNFISNHNDPMSPSSLTSNSMLQALAANGAAVNSQKKRLNSASTSMSLNSTLSKHSVDINAIKTGDSKYIIKKKKMLAEKAERERQLEREKELGGSVDIIDGSNNGTTDTNTLKSNSNNPSTATTMFGVGNGSSGSSANITHNHHTPTTNISTASTTTPVKIPSGPISLNSFVSGSTSTPIHHSSSSSKREKERGEKEKKKKSKSSSSAATLKLINIPPLNIEEFSSSSPNTPKIKFRITATPPASALPSPVAATSPVGSVLGTANQPSYRTNGNSTSSNGSSSSGSSTSGINTIKISTGSSSSSIPPKVPKPNPTTTITLKQYKIQQQDRTADINVSPPLPPIKSEKQQHQMLSSPIPRPIMNQSQPQASNNYTIPHSNNNTSSSSAEEIRCICENPTVDFGYFMIACDKCSVWYHGTCVGIAESDQVEEWYCTHCRNNRRF